MKFLLLSFLAGLVSACGFAPLDLWPLTLAGLVALMMLVARAPGIWSALLRGWAFGLGYFVLGLNWIATAFTYQSAMPAWLGWIAVLLLSVYLAVYPAMAAGLAWRYGRGDRLRLVLILAAAWIVTEWLRGTIFTGFAWNPAGVVLIDSWAKWAAPFVGTYGLSAVLVLLAGAVWLILSMRSRLRFPLAAGLVLILMIDLDLVFRSEAPQLAAQPLVRIVQPNIGQQDKWRPGFARISMARLASLSGRSGEPRLLLWPEAAITKPLEVNAPDPRLRQAALPVRAQVARMIGPDDLLLTGGIGFAADAEGKVVSATNSVFAMNPRGQVLSRYDKAHLVPYGEYLPMRALLTPLGLSRLAPGDSDFAPGPGPRNLILPGIGEVGLQICYEIVFSGHVVDDAHRPRFLFNPSNDAWFGRWGPPQHLAQARLRALEEGLPVLRSTPTGISAVIDAEGRLLDSIPWRQAGVIDARLPLAREPTPFARVGNAAGFALALLLAAIAVALRRRAR